MHILAARIDCYHASGMTGMLLAIDRHASGMTGMLLAIDGHASGMIGTRLG